MTFQVSGFLQMFSVSIFASIVGFGVSFAKGGSWIFEGLGIMGVLTAVLLVGMELTFRLEK